MQKNEEEREKAGNEEDKTQQEHTRLLQWSNTVTSAYEALAKAANEVVDRDQLLVDSTKADMIADGFSEDYVKQLRGAWVPADQKLQARADLLRLMEGFRDVKCFSTIMLKLPCGTLTFLWQLHACTVTSCQAVQSQAAYICCCGLTFLFVLWPKKNVRCCKQQQQQCQHGEHSHDVLVHLLSPHAYTLMFLHTQRKTQSRRKSLHDLTAQPFWGSIVSVKTQHIFCMSTVHTFSIWWVQVRWQQHSIGA